MRRDAAESRYLRQTHVVALHKAFLDDSTTVAGFLYVDLPGADAADGIVRRAKKVLQDGAKNLARSRTYSWALLEQQVSGASGGIHQPEDNTSTLDAFIAMATPLVESQSVSLQPAKGLPRDAFESLRRVDKRGVLSHAVSSFGPATNVLVARAGVHAATLAGVTIDEAEILIDAPLQLVGQIAHELGKHGAKIVGLQTESNIFTHPEGINADNLVAALNVPGVNSNEAVIKLADYEGWTSTSTAEFWATSCDVLFVGSNMGRLDHELAATVDTKVVVPIAPLPYTARAMATLTTHDITVVPDFVVMTAELVPFLSVDALPDPTSLPPMIGDQQLEQFAAASVSYLDDILNECLGHNDGVYIAAALRAEKFLATWQDELPFGRPLA